VGIVDFEEEGLLKFERRFGGTIVKKKDAAGKSFVWSTLAEH